MDFYVKNYKYVKDEMVSHFITECFDITEFVFDYIGEDIVMYNDYYFSVGDIVYVLSNGVDYDKFLEYYDSSLLMYPNTISLEEYLTEPVKLQEQKDKYLKELKDRVLLAEEEFKKALDEYNK